MFLSQDLSLLSNKYQFSKFLGHRDKQVLRQTLMTFTSIFAFKEKPITVLEIGAGLSSIVISDLLYRRKDGSKLISYDYRGRSAFVENTRSLDLGDEGWLDTLEIREEPSCSFDQLNDFYQSNNSTLGNMDQAQLLTGIESFVNWSLDDKKMSIIEKEIGVDIKTTFKNELSVYLKDNGLFKSPLFKLFRHDGDEFETLKGMQSAEIFDTTLKKDDIDVVYLDSGEFSSNVEFNKLDKQLKAGSIIVAQDILFPKSIKSFLIGAFLVMASNWRLIWQDNTTPQGILIAIKITI